MTSRRSRICAARFPPMRRGRCRRASGCGRSLERSCPPLPDRSAPTILRYVSHQEHPRADGGETMLARDEEILKAAEEWRRSGRGVALATVMETWGSAPRPVGANLVIDEEGNFLGSVSGGCVEGAVVAEALDVIESGKSKVLEFGVADETAWNVGLSCGGTIRVLVERVE